MAAVLTGLLLGVAIHSGTWWLRERHLTLAAVLGAACAASIFLLAWMFLSSPYTGEAHTGVSVALVALWVVAALLGFAHAKALRAPILSCVLAVFVEAGAGLGLGAFGAGVRDRLILVQRFDWQLIHRLYGLLIASLALTLLGLAVLQPVRLILGRRRDGK